MELVVKKRALLRHKFCYLFSWTLIRAAAIDSVFTEISSCIKYKNVKCQPFNLANQSIQYLPKLGESCN